MLCASVAGVDQTSATTYSFQKLIKLLAKINFNLTLLFCSVLLFVSESVLLI